MKSKRRARPSRAQAAGGIVMDVNTGEILAMVSLAGFRSQCRAC